MLCGALSSKAESRCALTLIEDHEDALEEDVAKDCEADTSVSLDTTEASATRDRCVVDVGAWDGESLAADGNAEVWQGARAGDGVATLRWIVAGALDSLVVGLHGGCWEIHQRGTSVGDGGADVALSCVATRAAAVGATSTELPETLRVVDRNVGNAAGVLGAVNVAAKPPLVRKRYPRCFQVEETYPKP